MKAAKDEVKKDLDPILDVFSGGDGGVAFARLYHDFLPKIYAKNDLERSDVEHNFVIMVKQFSKLCQVMQK